MACKALLLHLLSYLANMNRLTCIAIWREIIAFEAAEAINEDLNVWLESLYPREFDGCGTTKGATHGRRSSHLGVILPTLMVENWKIKIVLTVNPFIYLSLSLSLFLSLSPLLTMLTDKFCFQLLLWVHPFPTDWTVGPYRTNIQYTVFMTNYICILHRSNIYCADRCKNTCVVHSYIPYQINFL